MIKKTGRYLLWCLILVGALAWPLMASAQEDDGGPTDPPLPSAAAPIYETRCANCHGPTGEGDGPTALQAGLSVPDLTDPTRLRQTTPARWFDVISNGVEGAAMPPFGEASSNPLRPVDRWDLVFYLYTLGTPQEQVAMGQALYEQSCVACHGDDGTGRENAPGFTDLAAMATVSQADLFGAIADTSVAGHDLELGEVEIWALADYVRTFSYKYAPPSAGAAPAALDPFSGGAGVIRGRVLNGTPGGAVPEGIEVRLRAFDVNAAFISAITTTVAADGSFRFEGIDPAAPVQFEPLVLYRDVSYIGDLESAITLSPGQPEASADITVYETTEDDSAIRIERLHLVFDFAPGRTQVAELYIFSNDGDRVYVGTPEAGTVRLSVPAEALSFQPGGDPGRYLTLADGVADTVPIPPGQSTAESVLVYELAYEGELELSRPMPHDARVANVFVPDVGVQVSGDGVQPGGPFQAQDVTLQTYVATDLTAGERLSLRLSGELELDDAVAGAAVPSPHRTVGPDETQSIAIGGVVLAGALGLAFLYWQGYLNLPFGSADQDQQSLLLRAIADLDDDFEAGRMKEKAYRARRAELKEALVDLLEGERL